MPDPNLTHSLLNWYDDHARAFLKEHLSEQKLADFDRDRARLQKTFETSTVELSVCFLGNCGVGKSTLINSVIGGDTTVVPAGGVGPLTAQALVVRYSANPRFEVEYYGPGQVLRTIFGLEQMYKDELGKPGSDSGNLEGLEELEQSELVSVDEPAESENTPETAEQKTKSDKRENWRRRAQLLVTGKQDGERGLKYLLDSLRECAGGVRCWGTVMDPRDSDRIRGIAIALDLAKRKLRFSSLAETNGSFEKALNEHASGYLAPLIKSLELHWNSPVLQQGIALVDLPGVGVMRDVHREVTRYWIREKANALVLIVDHRGIHDSVAESLRQSEFLNTLLYSADEPEDDPIVLVAVTRIDDIANSLYQQDKNKKKFQHFIEACQEVRESLRHQMQRALHSIWLDGDDVPEARRKVVENVLSRLQVHPMSAPEYARLRANDEDNPPFLKTLEQTGVPNFVSCLSDLAAERRSKARERLRSQTTVFRSRLATSLELVKRQWESSARAEEEAKKLKAEMELFMVPLRKEFHVRQGNYRTVIKKGIPQRIEDLVEAASQKANLQINRYLLKLGSSHWATLRASVKRGGRYSGASDINLPSEFALRFEEPIAEIWSKQILKDIRLETKSYANDCVRMVEELANWALSQGARVQPKLIEAQRDAIRADARKLESVGHEMVEEMRDEAKSRLINSIESPIKRKCDSFVRANQHIGIGVKKRILELYGNMSDEVTDAAKGPTAHVLQKLFKDVEHEILDAFREHENPLDELAEAIVSSQESYVKRSDAQKKSKTLSSLDEVLGSMPLDSSCESLVEVTES